MAAMRINPSTSDRTFSPGNRRYRLTAFTLIEVVIAIAIFFVAIFAILDLVMVNVRAAHRLNRNGLTAGMVAAEFSMTNRVEEGVISGESEVYRGFTYDLEIIPFGTGTNGLYQVDITVYKDGNKDSELRILHYDPNSQQRV